MQYNVKCLHFADGETQTRMYAHPVVTGGKRERKEKNEDSFVDVERSMKNSLNRTIV
jgi:hypothetical protein